MLTLTLFDHYCIENMGLYSLCMLFKVGDKMIGFLEDHHKVNVTLKLIFEISTVDSTIQQIEVCSSNSNIEWTISSSFNRDIMLESLYY